MGLMESILKVGDTRVGRKYVTKDEISYLPLCIRTSYLCLIEPALLNSSQKQQCTLEASYPLILVEKPGGI